MREKGKQMPFFAPRGMLEADALKRQVTGAFRSNQVIEKGQFSDRRLRSLVRVRHIVHLRAQCQVRSSGRMRMRGCVVTRSGLLACIRCVYAN